MNNLSSLRAAASRWLGLLFAPLAISLATIVLTNVASNQAIPTWLWVLTFLSVAIALLLYSITFHRFLEKLLTRLDRRIRVSRFRRPRVLILDGTVEGTPKETPPAPVYSNRSTADWNAALSALHWTVTVGPTGSMLAQPSPDIVVNPFGEVYPEADFLTNSTVSQIRDYVWHGGVFVCVAGIPFWYRYNPFTRQRETAGRVESVIDNTAHWKPLIQDLFPNLTPSTEPLEVQATQLEVDVDRFGIIASAGNSPAITSFRAYPVTPAQLLPMLRDPTNQLCIVGAYTYGQGAFIFSGVSITDATPTFEKVVAAIRGWALYETKGRSP
jgi:hypothetical protein